MNKATCPYCGKQVSLGEEICPKDYRIVIARLSEHNSECQATHELIAGVQKLITEGRERKTKIKGTSLCVIEDVQVVQDASSNLRMKAIDMEDAELEKKAVNIMDAVRSFTTELDKRYSWK